MVVMELTKSRHLELQLPTVRRHVTDTKDLHIWCWAVIAFGYLIMLLMEEFLHQLRSVVYPIIYGALYIPGG